MRSFISVPCLTAVIFGIAGASPASAEWSPQWLSCSGQMVTTGMVDGKDVNETKPANDMYAFDDATKNLYKYSETRKTADPEGVTAYTADEIKWAQTRGAGHSSGPAWDGRIDRHSLALTLNYDADGAKTVWAQQCKLTDPPAGGSVAEAKSDEKS